MRKVMKSRRLRIGALVLSGIVLSGIVQYGAASILLLYGTVSGLFPLTAVLMLAGIMVYGFVLYLTAPGLLSLTLVRTRVLVLSGIMLSGIVLDGAAYTLLPRTADGVSVTVLRCATVQPVQPVQDFWLDCQGTTVFRRTFTDEATVSAVHAMLDGLPEQVSIFANISCNGGDLCAPTYVYSFDLLWHGCVVRSYVTSTPNQYWAVRTLGLELWATGDPTTWQDLVRLTGMPNGMA
jgi:hypothetical protein